MFSLQKSSAQFIVKQCSDKRLLSCNAKLVDVNVCCPNIKVTFGKVTFGP